MKAPGIMSNANMAADRQAFANRNNAVRLHAVCRRKEGKRIARCLLIEIMPYAFPLSVGEKSGSGSSGVC